MQETAIRMLQDNLKYFCQQLQPKYDQLKPGLNASHCAHGAALVSTADNLCRRSVLEVTYHSS
jgi:hypothetical protein